MEISAVYGSATTTPGASLTQVRMTKAAHEFEAQMMKELMQPLNGSDGLSGSEDESECGSTSALSDYAGQMLGQSLSQQGGFGIANKIIRSISPDGNQHYGNHISNHQSSVR
jgi:Rod binding domain-containing protein